MSLANPLQASFAESTARERVLQLLDPGSFTEILGPSARVMSPHLGQLGVPSSFDDGVIVGEGSVLSMGVYLSGSTKIVDRATGEIHIGRVPPYSVVVSGSLPGKPLPDGSQGPSLYCAVIVKTVDAQTRSKTGINELLRD